MPDIARVFAFSACVTAFALFALPATAAAVTLNSMRYSDEKPVPHLHYQGEVVAGDLQRIVDVVNENVACDRAALPASGGVCAVMTLESEGGNYFEGLQIAHFFRENAIATRLTSEAYCYSACAFAFLGGTGHSSQEGVGDYIDRTLEPGAILGFHAPYVAADSLGEMVAQYGVEEVLGGNRDNIALMIQELVTWNVDKSVLARITSMGPEVTYQALTAQDLYLLRVALPTTTRAYFAPDAVEALRNACTRLLAYHEDTWPYDVQDRVSGQMLFDIGVDESGRALSGYQLVDAPSGLTISYCAMPTSDTHLDGDADIALYYGRGIGGDMRPALSYFHRPDGWSTLGTGGTTTSRIFQKGPINHFFMRPDTELGGLALVWRLTGG